MMETEGKTMKPILRIYDPESGKTISEEDVIVSINSAAVPEKRLVWVSGNFEVKDTMNWQIEVDFETLFDMIIKALRE